MLKNGMDYYKDGCEFHFERYGDIIFNNTSLIKILYLLYC